jgi:hypothetical protein
MTKYNNWPPQISHKWYWYTVLFYSYYWRIISIWRTLNLCKEYGRSSWITKCVTLTNELGLYLGREIYHNFNVDLIVYSDNRPLDDDCIAIQNVELMLKEDLLFEWMPSMRAWHICHIFIWGTNLYDHKQ